MSSLTQHLSTVHQKMCKPIQEIPLRLFDNPQKTYMLGIPNDGSTISCPIENCPGHATTRHNMRRHFAELHPMVKITILVACSDFISVFYFPEIPKKSEFRRNSHRNIEFPRCSVEKCSVTIFRNIFRNRNNCKSLTNIPKR